jgi:hypothetical protein
MNTRVTRRLNFSGQFKAAVALKVLRGVLSEKVKKAKNKDGEIKKLHAKIGQLAVKNDFLLQGLKR